MALHTVNSAVTTHSLNLSTSSECNIRVLILVANRFEFCMSLHLHFKYTKRYFTFSLTNDFTYHSCFSFEKKYDPIPVLRWMSEHPMIPVAAVSIYGFLIVWGQHVMKKRPAWNWRNAMALWNLSLSVFSWIGMFRTAPQLASNLYHMSIRDNLCEDPRETYGSGSSGLWVQLFILSKFPYVQKLSMSHFEYIPQSISPTSTVNSLTHFSLSFTRNR